MTPTETLRTRLRKLLDERIPTGGSAADTRFADDDLDELLTEATSIYGAASTGWTMKAGMYQTEMGDVERMTLGQETEQMVSLKDRVSYALAMSERYASMGKSGSSMLLKVAPPEVL
jgi:hypothetical protein